METKNRLMKILAIAATVILLVFFASEIYSLTARTYTTRTIYEQTVLETVDAEMFVIRDETLLESDAAGTFVQIAENGERVSKGSTIAAFFPSEDSAHNYVKIETLYDTLDVYNAIESQTRLENVDVDKLSNQIKEDFDAIIDAAYNNNYSDLEGLKLSFNESLSKKQKSLGQPVDCSDKITQITEEITTLQQNVTPSTIVTAENSGYYVGSADGYENVLTVEDLDSLTVEDFESALVAERADIPENSIGKIINGYNWYVATVIDSAKVVGFEEGKIIKLVLGDSESDVVQTSIHSLQSVSGNRTLVVFRCNLMNDRLTSLRKVSGKVVISEHTGLKIGSDAVRFDENGNPGVYVRRANIINFRSINIIYSEESFVVARDTEDFTSDYPHIKLYDEVIISGKELSDGMVIG